MDEELNKLKVEDKTQKFHIDIANQLFENKEIGFNHTLSDKDRNECFKIVLNNSLTLFFFKKDDKWEYDGWEMGDYKDYWTRGKI